MRKSNTGPVRPSGYMGATIWTIDLDDRYKRLHLSDCDYMAAYAPRLATKEELQKLQVCSFCLERMTNTLTARSIKNTTLKGG